jgi:hypothetical protein
MLVTAIGLSAVLLGACSSGHPTASTRPKTTTTTRAVAHSTSTTAAPTTTAAAATTIAPTTTARPTTTTTGPPTTRATTAPPATTPVTSCAGCPTNGLPPSTWVAPTLAVSDTACTVAGPSQWDETLRLTFVTPAWGIYYPTAFNGWPGMGDPPAGYSVVLHRLYAVGGPHGSPPPVPTETSVGFSTQWGTEVVPVAPFTFPCT